MPLKDLNDITVATYQNNFQKYKEVTPETIPGELKDWIDSFEALLPKNGTIFELGCATGRDARYLSSLGYNVTCTDVVTEALNELSCDGFSVASYDFRDLPQEIWMGQFDGYLANAVLLHAPQYIFEQTLQYAHKILKRGGVAMIILKNGMGQEMIVGKLGAPRYFKYHNEENLKTTLAKMPFEIVSITPSSSSEMLRLIIRAL